LENYANDGYIPLYTNRFENDRFVTEYWNLDRLCRADAAADGLNNPEALKDEIQSVPAPSLDDPFFISQSEVEDDIIGEDTALNLSNTFKPSEPTLADILECPINPDNPTRKIPTNLMTTPIGVSIGEDITQAQQLQNPYNLKKPIDVSPIHGHPEPEGPFHTPQFFEYLCQLGSAFTHLATQYQAVMEYLTVAHPVTSITDMK